MAFTWDHPWNRARRRANVAVRAAFWTACALGAAMPFAAAHAEASFEGKSISVYVGNATEAAWLNAQGANVFVLSSDQGFLRQAAMGGLKDVRDKVGGART